jgi:ABC-type transport system involved in multi-copper enzyme maturation permease subunit
VTPALRLTRLVLRQHGVALAFVLALFAIGSVALTATEPILRHFVNDGWPGATVEETMSALRDTYGPKYPDLAMQAIPLVAAVFVGFRLVGREMEDGTAAFAWTQGYGKNRWLLGKLAVVSAVLVPAAAAFGLLFGWWYRVYVPATGYFAMHAFALYAPSLAGWMLAGLTLGMAAGAVTRGGALGEWLTLGGWIALHAAVTVGSASTPARDFWALQFAQLAILTSLAVLFTVVTIWQIEGFPAIPGMPRFLRAVPWAAERSAARLAAGSPGSLASRSRSRSRAGASRPSLAGAVRAAWRQHHTGLAAAAAILAVVAVALLVTGLRIQAEPAALRPRLGNLNDPGSTGSGNLLLPALLPFIIGAILGATVTARDLARGTAAFAWTQGIGRVRWITGKLVAAGSVLALAAVACGLVFQWWDRPYVNLRLTEPLFALYPPVFVGWTLACFAFAAFLGAVLGRRTAAAQICVAVMLPLAIAHAEFLRPRYFSPGLAINVRPPAGSVYVDEYVGNPDGQRITGTIAQHAQNIQANSQAAYDQALARLHLADVSVYQPASRFWELQALESAGLLVIAVAFAAATIWMVSRREI